MKNDVEASELRIARLIRVVVLGSAAVILLGLVLYLATGTSGYENGFYPVAPGQILSGVAAIKPYAVIMLGIFLLILTPILRVAGIGHRFFKGKGLPVCRHYSRGIRHTSCEPCYRLH